MKPLPTKKGLEAMKLLIADDSAFLRQEKNFIIRGHSEYIEKVAALVGNIKEQSAVTRARFKDLVNRKQMDDILAAINKYEKAFNHFVDLRLKFGMEEAEKTVDTCIVVMEVVMEGETVVLGAVADSVDEVIDQQPDQVEPPLSIGTNLNTEFIKGMGKRDDQFIIILDIDRIFTTEELSLVKETEKAVPGSGGAE